MSSGEHKSDGTLQPLIIRQSGTSWDEPFVVNGGVYSCIVLDGVQFVRIENARVKVGPPIFVTENEFDGSMSIPDIPIDRWICHFSMGKGVLKKYKEPEIYEDDDGNEHIRGFFLTTKDEEIATEININWVNNFKQIHGIICINSDVQLNNIQIETNRENDTVLPDRYLGQMDKSIYCIGSKIQMRDCFSINIDTPTNTNNSCLLDNTKCLMHNCQVKMNKSIVLENSSQLVVSDCSLYCDEHFIIETNTWLDRSCYVGIYGKTTLIHVSESRDLPVKRGDIFLFGFGITIKTYVHNSHGYVIKKIQNWVNDAKSDVDGYYSGRYVVKEGNEAYNLREAALQRAWDSGRQPQPSQSMLMYPDNPVLTAYHGNPVLTAYHSNPVYAAIILNHNPMNITIYLSRKLPLELIIHVLELLNIPKDISALTYKRYNQLMNGGGGGGGGGGAGGGSGGSGGEGSGSGGGAKKQKTGKSLYKVFILKV